MGSKVEEEALGKRRRRQFGSWHPPSKCGKSNWRPTIIIILIK
jgi:hypothetical protein